MLIHNMVHLHQAVVIGPGPVADLDSFRSSCIKPLAGRFWPGTRPIQFTVTNSAAVHFVCLTSCDHNSDYTVITTLRHFF